VIRCYEIYYVGTLLMIMALQHRWPLMQVSSTWVDCRRVKKKKIDFCWSQTTSLIL